MAYKQPKFEISKQVSGIKASPGKFLGVLGAAKLGSRLLDKVKGKDKKAEEASGSASGDHHHDHDHAGAASKRNNPGSKLQTAVTKDPSKLKKGSKDAGRRKSFCARSKGWKGERGLAARRRWNC